MVSTNGRCGRRSVLAGSVRLEAWQPGSGQNHTLPPIQPHILRSQINLKSILILSLDVVTADRYFFLATAPTRAYASRLALLSKHQTGRTGRPLEAKLNFFRSISLIEKSNFDMKFESRTEPRPTSRDCPRTSRVGQRTASPPRTDDHLPRWAEPRSHSPSPGMGRSKPCASLWLRMIPQRDPA